MEWLNDNIGILSAFGGAVGAFWGVALWTGAQTEKLNFAIDTIKEHGKLLLDHSKEIAETKGKIDGLAAK